MVNNKKSYSVAIIVINFRTPELITECLSKMSSTFENERVKLVVVDNDSQDDSVEKLGIWINQQPYASRITLVESQYNGGFSYGNNLGIKAVEADYYLLLNSDAYLVADCLDRLLIEIDKDKKIGIVSPKLTWPDSTPQESTFRFHHPLSEFIDQSKTGYISRLFSNYIVAHPVQEADVNVEWTSFACVLIKKSLIEDIGLLDDEFFMYFEDVDYCFQASKSGWLVRHIPKVSAVHLRGGSSDVKKNTQLKKELPKYYYQSRTRIYFKCYGWLGLFFANILWYMGRSIALLRMILGSKKMHGIKGQARGIWTNFFNPKGPFTHPSEVNK